MKQYHEHLQLILDKGSRKEPAREGMPGSISLFGHQNRYNLSEGFPILTTKKVKFKNIVTELLWFLKGDTNVKFLNDNGFTLWNEDAYNYYVKLCKKVNKNFISFEAFVDIIKNNPDHPHSLVNYSWGDCGKQYGWLWRNWENQVYKYFEDPEYQGYGPDTGFYGYENQPLDQIKNLIEGLKKNPEGRRHIITAWNPATIDDMALPACHSFVQFNCRRLTLEERWLIDGTEFTQHPIAWEQEGRDAYMKEMDNKGIQKFYLDCQLYQRSADMFLGVPYNIASYALLTHIIAKICNMIPGEFIHTFGDSHIYDNHMDQVKEILSRDPEKYKLPKLLIVNNSDEMISEYKAGAFGVSDLIDSFEIEDFQLEGYESYPFIAAPLSTGLKK